jgi:sigma-E factor negative regulatory protein RseA
MAQQGGPSPVTSAVVATTAQRSGLQTVSAQADAPADTGVSLSAVQPQRFVASGKLIRDARLDQYLAAHKQFGGSTALGAPSGFLRSATSESRDR